MGSDLQDPPELIGEFVRRLAGRDQGRHWGKSESRESQVMFFLRRSYYKC